MLLEQRRSYRNFAKAAYFALQSGITTYAVSARLRLISQSLQAGIVRYDDKTYIVVIGSAIEDVDTSVLSSACVDLAHCLLYYSQQQALERTATRVRAELGDDRRADAVDGFATVGQIWLGEVPSNLPTNVDHIDALLHWLQKTGIGDLWMCGLGCLGMTLKSDGVAARLSTSKFTARLCGRRGAPGWGQIHTALTLALWLPIPFNLVQWTQFVETVRSYRGLLPVALEWQRLIVESREHRRIGDLSRSRTFAELAVSQLELFANGEYQRRGCAAYERWINVIGPELPMSGAARSSERSTSAAATSSLPNHSDCQLTEWADCWDKIRSSDKIMVLVERPGDSDWLIESLRSNEVTSVVVWAGQEHLSRLQPNAQLIIVRPYSWRNCIAQEAVESLRSQTATKVRTAALIDAGMETFATSVGGARRELLDMIIAPYCRLPDACGTQSGKEEVLRALCTKHFLDERIDTEVLDILSHHVWVGGVAELETLIIDLSRLSAERIDLSRLRQIGWQDHVSSSVRADEDLIFAVRETKNARISELAARVNRPKRTTLRHLERLVNQGKVIRVGRGRATCYRWRADSGVNL